MTRVLHLFATLLAATLLLVACGDQPTAEAPEPSEPTAAPAATAAGSAALDEYEDLEGYPRTVVDMLGREVTFDAPPERVVVLYNNNFGQLAALGVRPVGAAVADELLADDDFFEDGETITDLAIPLDLEVIAALEPDLILSWGEEESNLMQQFAPVFSVAGEEDLAGTIDHFLRLGQVFDVEDTAHEFVDAFSDRLAAYQALTSDEAPSILLAYATDVDTFWVNTANQPECQILNILATCEWTLDADGPVTVEGLLTFDPEVLLVVNETETPNDEFFGAMADNPLWSELTAVQNDRIVSDDDYGDEYEEPLANSIMLAKELLDNVTPTVFPEIFSDGPLTDEEVQEILAEQ